VDTRTRLTNNIIDKLLERRVLLIALLCAVGIAFETIDNLVDGEAFDPTYWRETVFFGLIYPIGVGWLLTHLLRARTERDQVLRKQRLIEDMMAVPSWTMLLDTIVAIPRRVVPVVAVGLYLQSDEGGDYPLVSEWSLLPPNTEFWLKDVDPLKSCGADKVHPQISAIHPIRNLNHQAKSALLKGYCLPIMRRDEIRGFLQIYLPSTEELTESQIQNIQWLAEPISAALETRTPDDLQFARTAATRLERERIAHLLHDTLGQSLTYMRSVLEQLNMDELHARISSIQRDLDRMRDITDDAYEQTRQTLRSLQPQYEGNLSDVIHELASKMSEMAGFELSYRVRGTHRQLIALGDVQRRIVLIVREVLNNIQRHAQAKLVSISLFWDEENLVITVEDDGVGFTPSDVPEFGHFGIQIMKQRSEEIKGTLEVTSQPGQGTKVILQCPLDTLSVEHEG
jgi:signal transduction histidine kinase